MVLRRIFANTVPAPDASCARSRVLALYREWLREAPRTISKYPLEVTVGEMRARIRFEFERFQDTTELPLINVLLLKGTQELIETHNRWKQKTHVMRYFDGTWSDTLRIASRPAPPSSLASANALPVKALAAITNPSPFLSAFLTNRQ